MSRYDEAFGHIVVVEGGYVNDPRDPGGETKYGITDGQDGKVDGKVDVDGDGTGDVPVGKLTIADAKVVYHRNYWTPARCDDLPWPLAAFVFDSAVNQGVQAALKLLQRALGTVQDGVIGRNTLAAIARADQKELCALYMAHRGLRYTGTRNFDTFGLGWFKRLFKIAMEV